jgi:hypothetical protein
MGAEGGRGTLDFVGQGAVPLNFPLASTLKYIQIYFIIQADKTVNRVLRWTEGHLTLKGRIMCPSISL